MMSAALTCKINFYVVWIVLCSCISPCQSHAILSPSYGFRLFNIKGICISVIVSRREFIVVYLMTILLTRGGIHEGKTSQDRQ